MVLSDRRDYRILLLAIVASLTCTVISQDERRKQAPPSIVESPKQEEFIDPRSEYAVLKCVARGEPAPTYEWRKDGRVVPINGDTIALEEGTLKIKKPNPRFDEGEYQCFATNAFGTALSHKVALVIGHLDRFELSDERQESFQLYAGAKLSCDPPSGAPPPRVFWSKKLPQVLLYSERINQDPDGNLIFANILDSDKGQYYCNVIVDSLGELRQAPLVNVTVATVIPAQERAPNLMYHPDQEEVVLKGESMMLKCLAEGYPTPEIVWERIDAPLPMDRVMHDSFGQLLIIERVEYSDEGSYRCTAANGVSPPKSWVVGVSVEAAPFWEEDPIDKTIPPESDYVMQCQAGGIPAPRITWLENGAPISDPGSNPRRRIQGDSITFTNARVEDTSVYQCVAENTHGELMTSLFLNVVSVPAEIRVPPARKTRAVEESTVTIDCLGFGSPDPTITWSYGGQELSGDQFEILPNGTLIINNLQKSNAGSYKCTVKNDFGEETKTGKLEVKTKTQITIPPSDTFVREGDAAEFKCSVTTYEGADLNVFWERDDTRLDTELATSRYTVGDDGSLIISRTQMSDTNDYVCVAQTDLDEVKAEARLTVQNVPTQPLNLRLENANDIEVDLTWSPSEPNNSPLEKYIVQYTTSFTNFGDFQELMNVPAGQTTANLNLSPWVTYKFRVIARNAIGNSAPSEVYGEYSTQPAAPTENPKKLAGKGTRPDNMIITWEPVPEEEHNGVGFYYLLKYRKEGATTWEDEPINNWRETQFIVTDTPTFTPYEISIQSINEKGSTGQPTEAIGFSGEDAPKEAPTDVAFEIINSTCVKVMWTKLKNEDVQGVLLGYKVRYSGEPTAVQRQKRQAEQEEAEFDQSPGYLNDLTPHTDYTMTVLAFNSAGDGKASAPVAFRTPQGPPGPVANFEVTSLSGGMYLSWDFPESPNGVITGYVIKYNKVRGTETGAEKQEMISDPYIFKKKIYGLSAEEQYDVRIAAHTEDDVGEYTQKRMVPRVVGPPAPPSAPIFTLVGDSTMNVTWDEIDDTEPSVDKYVVMYKQSGNGEEGWEESPAVDPLERNWHILSGLNSGTKYDVKIRAMNNEGDAEGPMSTQQTSGAGAIAAADNFYSEGWFIGLMCVIVFLLIILLIICLIKRNKGGKYHVSEKEDQLHGDIESVPHKDDDGGFGEYKGKDSPDTVDPSKKPDTGSLSSRRSGDTDSMAEYGDGETGQFNEDGSFIGQYGDEKKRKQEQAAETDASSPAAFSTFV